MTLDVSFLNMFPLFITLRLSNQQDENAIKAGDQYYHYTRLIVQPLRYRGESHAQIQSFCRVYLFTNKGH